MADGEIRQEVSREASIKRRGLLRFGTILTAFTGASAVSALGANSAKAGPGDKTPPANYVPIAEKGAASGVATLDGQSKIPPEQIPDISSRTNDLIQAAATDPTGFLPASYGSEIERAGSPANAALAARDALNILDYGVVRGTDSSQTAAIKAALDANPGKTFHFPPGDYRLDTGLVISQANSLRLAEDARLYAGGAMTTLITYLWSGSGYAEDKAITGGLLDGNLLARRILSLGKVIRFTLTRTNFRNGINRGLVTEAGLGAELFAYDLRFYNTGATNVADNIAIEANMGDSHYRDIIIRDWTTAVKDTSANRWDRIHPWISQDTLAAPQMTNRYPTSIGFDLTGMSDLQGCLSDTYRTAYKFRTNGTRYTAPTRLLNCRAIWAGDPILTTTLAQANQSYVMDNTDGVGVISDRFTVTGHTTAPTLFLTGPATNLDVARTKSYGFVLGAQGTTGDSFDYRNGVRQGTTLFTPTFYGSAGAGVHTYTTQAGRMVVDGETATYFIQIGGTLDSSAAFAGRLRVGGLPLPAGSTGVRGASGAVGYAVNINSTGCVIFASTAPWIGITTNLGASGVQETNVATHALQGKTVDLMLTITVAHYKV